MSPTSSALPPPHQRYFEDYAEGAVYAFGSIPVETDEVVAFAERFDPQPMHTDPAAAAAGPFRGIIASGWHTASLTMRLYVQHYLTQVASLASPGVDELRWLKPVRPGDVLSIRVTVLEKRRSQSKPDRGMVRGLVETFNQDGEAVMTVQTMSLIGCRPPGWKEPNGLGD